MRKVILLPSYEKGEEGESDAKVFFEAGFSYTKLTTGDNELN